MNPHNWLTALDPPGTTDRRWKCQYCHEQGHFNDLMGPDQKNPCAHEYLPCRYCKGTPTCEPDCTGLWAILETSGAIPPSPSGLLN